MALELKQFLLTGMLGPIRPGLTKAQIRQTFGEPDGERVYNAAFSGIHETRCSYGALVLSFQEEYLSDYALAVMDAPPVPRFLEPTGYFPRGNDVEMSEFLRYLSAEQIPCRGPTPSERNSCSWFTRGEVAILGHRRVTSLYVPCVGTHGWRTVKGPGKPAMVGPNGLMQRVPAELQLRFPPTVQAREFTGGWRLRNHCCTLVMFPSHKDYFEKKAGLMRQPTDHAGLLEVETTPVAFGPVTGVKQVAISRTGNVKNIAYELEVPGGYATAGLAGYGVDWPEAEFESFFDTIELRPRTPDGPK